jgi:hypothetical protein
MKPCVSGKLHFVAFRTRLCRRAVNDLSANEEVLTRIRLEPASRSLSVRFVGVEAAITVSSRLTTKAPSNPHRCMPTRLSDLYHIMTIRFFRVFPASLTFCVCFACLFFSVSNFQRRVNWNVSGSFRGAIRDCSSREFLFLDLDSLSTAIANIYTRCRGRVHVVSCRARREQKN